MRNPLRRLYRRLPRLRRALRRLKNAAVYWPAYLALAAVGRLSLERALAVCERAGVLGFWLLVRSRRLALEHLRVAFGDELSEPARVRLARAAFVNVARSFCEIAKMDEVRARLDDYFEVDGWEHVDAVLARGSGAVVVTGHIGNWELLAAYFALKGLPVAAIARRIYEPRLNQLIVDFRARHGVRTILRESPHATRDILRVMKEHGLLAMVIDQDTKAASVTVPFFGRAARTPAAAASLALRRDLPVLAAFIQRRAQGGHRITVLPPFAAPHTGELRSDIRELTLRFNHVLEEQIRKNPAEWVWWHRRWHRAPILNLDLDSKLPYSYRQSVL